MIKRRTTTSCVGLDKQAKIRIPIHLLDVGGGGGRLSIYFDDNKSLVKRSRFMPKHMKLHNTVIRFII